MFITLELEDLFFNALIELIENNVSKSVSYQTIIQYGNVVVKELKRKNIEAMMLISRDKTMQFEDDYSEMFDYFEIEDIKYVKLKDNISADYLRKYFRINQSLEVLIAMTSYNSKQALGINTEAKKLLRQK